jgi:EpsI family protein
VLPDGIIQVAEACSGLNLLLAALVLGVLQAALSLRSNWRRLLVVAIAVAIGVVDNWIRVFVLIVIAHYSEMRSSLVSDHIGFGWTLFAVSLIPFFLIARAIERGEKSAEVAHARVAEVAATVPKVGAAAVAAAFVALAAVGLSTYAGHLERSTTSAVKAFAPPPGALATTSGWLPEYTGYDLAQTWRLASAQRVYDLAVLLYSEQRQGKKLIYYSNRIADSALVRYTTKIALASGQNVNLTVLGGKEPRAVWWYYRIDGTATTSTWRAKMLQLRATLKGDSSAALVVISVRCRDRDCAADVVAESGGALLQNLDASLQALPAEHRG